jgi:hypothetical protein
MRINEDKRRITSRRGNGILRREANDRLLAMVMEPGVMSISKICRVEVEAKYGSMKRYTWGGRGKCKAGFWRKGLHSF